MMIIILLIIRFHNGLSLPGWMRKLNIQYQQNIPQNMHKIWSLTVKPNSWHSRGKTVRNKQKNGQKASYWSLQTSIPVRMSSTALPAVILGETKSLIPKDGDGDGDGALESWQITCLVETI